MLPGLQVLFAWAVLGFLLGFVVRAYPCPRCGKKFHHRQNGSGAFRTWVYNDFARSCMHCGLKLDGSNP